MIITLFDIYLLFLSLVKCNIIWPGIGIPLLILMRLWSKNDTWEICTWWIWSCPHIHTNVGQISFFWDIRHIRIFVIILWIKILQLYFKKNLDILTGYQIFTFFNLTKISLFLDIHLLFINRISIDLDIKNSKNCLPIILGASLFLLGQKISQRRHFFFEGNILLQIIFF
jgi:hypothetical protein